MRNYELWLDGEFLDSGTKQEMLKLCKQLRKYNETASVYLVIRQKVY